MKSLSEEEKMNLSKYGRFPSRPIARQSRLKERKYFDSGDYALSKAGNKEVQNVGHDHPSPNSIPHYVSAPPPAAPVVGVSESAGESAETADAASPSPSSLQTLAGGSPGVAIVNTDSPTSTMVNPSCLATETSAASALQPTAAAAASAASAGEDAAAPAFRMPFGAPAATSLPSDAASAAPASASASTPPARPAFTRRVSQVAGTQYRVKD
ncbi:hypothetical protein H4S06_003897 [Coemansia sp. BCRC 34490]|nr:hypothetical protein H4S06_003897 [Coemansia sp. BCRC 34490]